MRQAHASYGGIQQDRYGWFGRQVAIAPCRSWLASEALKDNALIQEDTRYR
jgi:hypothetical protein